MSRYNWTKVKAVTPCKKCCHYYSGNHTTHSMNGYNPLPYCHRFEDVGKNCNPFTFECFEKIKKVKESEKDERD